MSAPRRAAVVAVALLCGRGARADDEPLPHGAVARFVAPAVHEDDDGGMTTRVPPIEHLALSRDGRALVAALESGPLVEWDVPSPTPRVLTERRRGDVTGVAFSPTDDNEYATCSDKGDVRARFLGGDGPLPMRVGRTHGPAYGPAFSPDGSYFAAATEDGRLVVWDVPTDRLVLPAPKPPGDGRRSIAWSPDGTQIAVGDFDGALVLRNVAGGGSLQLPRTFEEPITMVAFAPDATALIVLAGSTLHAFSAPELSVPPKSVHRAGDFTYAAHSPTSRLVAAGGVKGRLFLLDSETLADVGVATGHDASITAVAFSGDGQRVASGDADGVVIVWDVATVLGHEPRSVARARIAHVEPGPGRPRKFPPDELRVGKAEGLADGERIEPYAGALPNAKVGDDEVRAVLVVDGTTGLPLPGAVLSLFEEDLGGPPAPAFERRWTDANGLAFVVWDPRRDFGHWVVEHEGFAPCYQFEWNRLRSPVVLMPRPDAVGRILGPYGAPVAGAEVELFLGCGHSPTVRRATTAEDGTFRLPACLTGEGNVVVHAPGCAATYLDVQQFGALGEEPVTFVLRPGADVRGRVVDADGFGVPWIGVKADAERSITRTGADGTFLLRGVATGDDLSLIGPPDVGEILSVPGSGGGWGARWGVVWSQSDAPILITIPAGDDVPLFATGPAVQFDVLDVDRETGAPVRLDDGELVASTSGYRYFGQGKREKDQTVGVLRFVAPEGTYLLVPGLPFSEYAGEPFEVRVVRGQEVPQIARVAAQPRLDVRVEGPMPSDADVVVVAAGHTLDLSRLKDAGGHIPAAGPAAVVVRSGAMQRAFPVGPEHDGVREAVVTWPQPKRITVHGLVGKDILLVHEVQGRIVATDADAGTCVIETDATGAIHLELWDGEERASADVIVPAEPGATADVQVRRPMRTTFAFRNASGEPIARTEFGYEVWDSGKGCSDGGGTDETRADGIADHIDAATIPCVVEFHPHGWAPRRVLVRREGEQLVAWGDATLVVEVVDADERSFDAGLYVDGMLVDAPNGTVTLRGMDSGRRTILVGAADRQTQAVDVNLARGAERTIRVVLPELPR